MSIYDEYKKWTLQEELFIIDYMDKLTTREIAERLGVNTYKTSTKIRYMRKIYLDNNKNITENDRIKAVDKLLAKYEEKEQYEKENQYVEEENQRILKMKIAELDGNLSIGRKYRITKPISNGKERTVFEGTLEKIYDRFYNIKGPYMESFLKIDFIIGEYRIEEV